MAEEEKYEYTCSEEELDQIIDKMEMGITPILSDIQKLEVEIRIRQHMMDAGIYVDQNGNLNADINRRSKALKEGIEKQRRTATHHDVIVIKISQEQKDQIRKEMESSLIRKDPNSSYNIPDETLYRSKEQMNISQKLLRLQNCYYNAKDFKNAIEIIEEAVQFSCANDYPWMTHDEVVAEFNRGNIRFSYRAMPKLHLDAKQITDPELLIGIVTGNVTVQRSNRLDPDRVTELQMENAKSEGVYIPYDSYSTESCKLMEQAHHAGYITPMAAVLDSRKGYRQIYNSPLFAEFKPHNQVEEVEQFDWVKEGSGENYYRRKYGVKYGIKEILMETNARNSSKLVKSVTSNAEQFFAFMNHAARGGNMETSYSALQQQELKMKRTDLQNHASQVENELLNRMRMSNPNPVVSTK